MRLRPILPAFAALSLSCAGPSHRPVEPGARSTSVVEEPVALDRSDDGARPVRGPAPVDASTTLDDLLERAALWSPRARAAEARWRAAYERVPQASRLSDPRFAWTEFVEGVQTRTGEQQRRFVLSQRFPWPGTLDARERAAAHGADAARAAAVADVIEIQRGVAHLWYELAYVSAAREVVAQNVALIESLQPVVLGRIRAGGPREDALRLEVRIARERDELSSLGEREAQVRARLIAAVGLTESATLPPRRSPASVNPSESSTRCTPRPSRGVRCWTHWKGACAPRPRPSTSRGSTAGPTSASVSATSRPAPRSTRRRLGAATIRSA